jgi:hypothetical protein
MGRPRSPHRSRPRRAGHSRGWLGAASAHAAPFQLRAVAREVLAAACVYDDVEAPVGAPEVPDAG